MTYQDKQPQAVVQDNGLKPAIDMYALKPGDYITLAGVDIFQISGIDEDNNRLILDVIHLVDTNREPLDKLLRHLKAECESKTHGHCTRISVDDVIGAYTQVDFSPSKELVGAQPWGKNLGVPIQNSYLAPIENLRKELIGLQVYGPYSIRYRIAELETYELSFFLPKLNTLPFVGAVLTPINRFDGLEDLKVDLREVLASYHTLKYANQVYEQAVLQEELAKDRRSYVYRMWDKDGVLLYIGKSNNPLNRWKQHRKKPWFEQVTRFEYEPHPDEASAYAAEREAIKTEHPLYNIVNNGVK